VTDATGVLAANVTVDGTSTTTTSALNCTQTSVTQVDCTISIDTSGDLVIAATDNASNNATSSETGYIVDTVDPTAASCTFSPNPASTGITVTATCTGVETGGTVTIPNMVCGAELLGTVICTGVSENINDNPPITTVDPLGNTTNSPGVFDYDNGGPAVTINTLTDIDGLTDETNYSVTGTCSVGDGNVTVLMTGATPATQAVSCTVGGTWSALFDTTAITSGADVIIVNANQTDL